MFTRPAGDVVVAGAACAHHAAPAGLAVRPAVRASAVRHRGSALTARPYPHSELSPRRDVRDVRDFHDDSFLGSTCTGRPVGDTNVVARPAVVRRVTGRAWITGTVQYFLDPTDPISGGFLS